MDFHDVLVALASLFVASFVLGAGFHLGQSAMSRVFPTKGVYTFRTERGR